MLTDALQSYRYVWPQHDLAASPAWLPTSGGAAFERTMPESAEELAADSRWPAFFPSPLCLVTVRDGLICASLYLLSLYVCLHVSMLLCMHMLTMYYKMRVYTVCVFTYMLCMLVYDMCMILCTSANLHNR